MKKNIGMLIVKIIIEILVLSWLIANFIILVSKLINGQVLELVIGGVICVGLVIAYNFLDKEERE